MIHWANRCRILPLWIVFSKFDVLKTEETLLMVCECFVREVIKRKKSLCCVFLPEGRITDAPHSPFNAKSMNYIHGWSLEMLHFNTANLKSPDKLFASTIQKQHQWLRSANAWKSRINKKNEWNISSDITMTILCACEQTWHSHNNMQDMPSIFSATNNWLKCSAISLRSLSSRS